MIDCAMFSTRVGHLPWLTLYEWRFGCCRVCPPLDWDLLHFFSAFGEEGINHFGSKGSNRRQPVGWLDRRRKKYKITWQRWWFKFYGKVRKGAEGRRREGRPIQGLGRMRNVSFCIKRKVGQKGTKTKIFICKAFDDLYPTWLDLKNFLHLQVFF